MRECACHYLKADALLAAVRSRTRYSASGVSTRYVCCDAERRFLLLFTFLQKNRNKKVAAAQQTASDILGTVIEC